MEAIFQDGGFVYTAGGKINKKYLEQQININVFVKICKILLLSVLFVNMLSTNGKFLNGIRGLRKDKMFKKTYKVESNKPKTQTIISVVLMTMPVRKSSRVGDKTIKYSLLPHLLYLSPCDISLVPK